MSKRRGRGGKRILSLGAVLPPEIFDRLTRPPEEDDSSTSSFEGGGGGDDGNSKNRKRRHPDNNECADQASAKIGGAGGGDRTELNSLLNELRSTPLHVSTKKTSSKSGGGGGASSKKNDDVTDSSNSERSGKLGMAFMSYTSSTTTTKKGNEVVVDVHAQPKNSITQTSNEGVATAKNIPSKPAMPKFSRMSAAAPPVATSFARNVSQYLQASPMPEYPVEPSTEQAPIRTATQHKAESSYNNTIAGPKSRKQKREEERALRSGQAFHNPDSSASAGYSEMAGPSPNEFAPTAHAAAIASKAARYRGAAMDGSGGGGGGGSVKNIAMYDPKSGTDVKGMGVTGKHKSKHQINQLMASAISLESHRASEAELARFGAGGGGGAGSGKGSRADAKRKYGW
ncbi:hypothetical protein ACHAXR_002465 [Thalassiosira sp. AJA248-18]